MPSRHWSIAEKSNIQLRDKSWVSLLWTYLQKRIIAGIIGLPPYINLVLCSRKYFLWEMWLEVSFLSLKCVFIFILKSVVEGEKFAGLKWPPEDCALLKFFCRVTAGLVQNSKLRNWWKPSALANREFSKYVLLKYYFRKHIHRISEMLSQNLPLHFEFTMKPEPLQV